MKNEKKKTVHLPDTDNESNDSEILPKKRKRAFHAQFFIIKPYRKGLRESLFIFEFIFTIFVNKIAAKIFSTAVTNYAVFLIMYTSTQIHIR